MSALSIIGDIIWENRDTLANSDNTVVDYDAVAAKVIDALHLAGYGVLDPREIMLNAANAVELRELRIQRQAVRKFLGLPVDGLTYTPSPSAYDEPDDLGYSGLDRSFDDHAGWQGGGL